MPGRMLNDWARPPNPTNGSRFMTWVPFASTTETPAAALAGSTRPWAGDLDRLRRGRNDLARIDDELMAGRRWAGRDNIQPRRRSRSAARAACAAGSVPPILIWPRMILGELVARIHIGGTVGSGIFKPR
jgi:hypothetical protein